MLILFKQENDIYGKTHITGMTKEKFLKRFDGVLPEGTDHLLEKDHKLYERILKQRRPFTLVKKGEEIVDIKEIPLPEPSYETLIDEYQTQLDNTNNLTDELVEPVLVRLMELSNDEQLSDFKMMLADIFEERQEIRTRIENLEAQIIKRDAEKRKAIEKEARDDTKETDSQPEATEA